MAGSAQRDLVAIGGSAGASGPLQAILGKLPVELGAAILICLHRHPDSNHFLTDMLSTRSNIPVMHPQHSERLAPGRALVAPPNVHMIVQDGRIRLNHGPRENMSRPAIDVTFRSAAIEAGPRTVGVLLSGMLDDGAAGLRAIERCGGRVLIQSDADYPDMPEAAEAALERPELLPGEEIADRLTELLDEPVEKAFEPPADLLVERDIALGRSLQIETEDQLGKRSNITCPECSGPLWEMQDPQLARFRCHTGHAYSLQSLGSAQVNEIEQSLWTAMRALRERASTLRRLAKRARDPEGRRQWEERADEADGSADKIAEGLVTLGRLPTVV